MLFLFSVIIDHVLTLREHLSYIEQKCRQVVARKRPSDLGFHQGLSMVDAGRENDADELYVAVLEHLQKDDYKALRSRKEESCLRTYLAVVIGNLYTDSIRRIRGRDLRRERAQVYGITGDAVYRHSIKGDYTLEAVQELLASHHGISATVQKLADIRDHIENSVKSDPDMIGKLARADNHEDADAYSPFEIKTDQGPDARMREAQREAQREALARQLLDEFETRLSGTEKLIIAMKFPAEDAEGKSFKEIATLLDMTPKTVEHAYYGCIARFREKMISSGVSFDAVVNCEA